MRNQHSIHSYTVYIINYLFHVSVFIPPTAYFFFFLSTLSQLQPTKIIVPSPTMHTYTDTYTFSTINLNLINYYLIAQPPDSITTVNLKKQIEQIPTNPIEFLYQDLVYYLTIKYVNH